MPGNFSAGRPTNGDNSRARAYCVFNRCVWGVLIFLSPTLSFILSPSVGDGSIKTETLSQGAV